MEGKYTGTRYVHSKGDVQAKIWYSKKERMQLSVDEKKLTGQEEKKYKLCINNFEINLSKKLPKFENYDTISTNNKLKIFSNFYFLFDASKSIKFLKYCVGYIPQA